MRGLLELIGGSVGGELGCMGYVSFCFIGSRAVLVIPCGRPGEVRGVGGSK